jgi:hypothetical protein
MKYTKLNQLKTYKGVQMATKMEQKYKTFWTLKKV